MSEEREEKQEAVKAEGTEGTPPSSEREPAEAAAPTPAEGEGKPAPEAEAKPAAAPPSPHTVATAGRPPWRERISRRGVLRTGFWVGLLTTIAGLGAVLLDLIYPRKVTGFGGVVSAGNVADVPAGEKVRFTEGRFWLVNLTEEQGGPGLLALWQKCPHLGCTVPWRPDFVFTDPETGESKKGWFRCPCHGSTYDDAGVRVFGPAPRSMDTMGLSIDENENISVDTGDVTSGSQGNPDRAVEV
jgi:cytochrome b6-f complex iron-sulfur subunit